MKNRSLIILFTLILAIIAFPTISCGRSIIKGQVVDFETNKPIAGAAVYIYWGKRGKGPPGLAAETVKVDIAEDLSDSNGFFEIPKYSSIFKHYDMAVYKKGYVCWSSSKLFPSWKDRKDFKLKNDMVIKLKPFKEEYSKEDHARFTVFSQVGISPNGIFDEAIKSEISIRQKSYKKSKGD